MAALGVGVAVHGEKEPDLCAEDVDAGHTFLVRVAGALQVLQVEPAIGIGWRGKAGAVAASLGQGRGCRKQEGDTKCQTA